jgi:hypothetical protein
MASSGSPSDDGAPRVFSWGYTVLVWLSMFGLLALTIWLFWTLFVHTASGTTRGLSVAESKATQTAVFETLAGITPGASPAGPRPTAPPDYGSVELPATCRGCHLIANTSAAGTVCPELTHIAALAEEIIASPEYTGKAKTVEEYIRESITDPNAHVVSDKPTYFTTDASGAKVSVMPAAIGAALSPAELDLIVGYLASRQ